MISSRLFPCLPQIFGIPSQLLLLVLSAFVSTLFALPSKQGVVRHLCKEQHLHRLETKWSDCVLEEFSFFLSICGSTAFFWTLVVFQLLYIVLVWDRNRTAKVGSLYGLDMSLCKNDMAEIPSRTTKQIRVQY
jgi:hypothetical protein